MVLYDDLPPELRSVFGTSWISFAMRQLITDGWKMMDTDEQSQLVRGIQKKYDPRERIMLAIITCSKKILLSHPTEE